VEKPTYVRFQVLAVACSLAVLTYIQRQGFVAATPYIKEDLGLRDGQMGYLLAVWLVAYGLFQVPGGLVGDRIGARHLISLLVMGWSLTLLAVALTVFLPTGSWVPFAVLLVLRFIFGGFQAGVFPGLARVVADWMPEQQRGSAQGSIWTFSRIGGALAPVFVVWLITKVFHGWSITITLIATLGLIWSAFFWLWFRNRPEEMPHLNAAERKLISQSWIETPRAVGSFPWRRFLSSPNVWGLCLMYGFSGYAGNFITSFLNVYLRDHRNLPDTTTAWLAGVPLAAGIVSSLTGGVVSAITLWHYSLLTAIASQAIGAVGLIVIAQANSASMLMVGMALLGQLIGYNYFSGLFYSTAGSVNKGRTLAAGIHEATLAGGMAMGTLLGGVLGTYVSVRSPYWLAATCVLILIVLQSMAWRMWMLPLRRQAQAVRTRGASDH
jgi:MFS transporter, ACS family, glucarate transporter